MSQHAPEQGAGSGLQAPGHGAAGGQPDLGEMLLHHTTDAPELELPWGTIHLPRWDPIHLGPLTLDLSPSKHVVFLLLAAVLCVVLFVGIARAMKRKYTSDAPSGFANAVEAFIIYFRDEVTLANIGRGGERFVPLVLTLFFFILFMNLLGLVPWGATATGNLSVTAALAFVALVVIEVSGMLELGPRRYLGTIFFAPEDMPWWGRLPMMLIMAPVEFMGKLAKPFALAVRLFANMTAGHFVIFSLLGIIFIFAELVLGRWLIAGGSVLMATAVMVLEVFIAFLQAYIFAMLTAVFIGLIRHAH